MNNLANASNWALWLANNKRSKYYIEVLDNDLVLTMLSDYGTGFYRFIDVYCDVSIEEFADEVEREIKELEKFINKHFIK